MSFCLSQRPVVVLLPATHLAARCCHAKQQHYLISQMISRSLLKKRNKNIAPRRRQRFPNRQHEIPSYCLAVRSKKKYIQNIQWSFATAIGYHVRCFFYHSISFPVEFHQHVSVSIIFLTFCFFLKNFLHSVLRIYHTF